MGGTAQGGSLSGGMAAPLTPAGEVASSLPSLADALGASGGSLFLRFTIPAPQVWGRPPTAAPAAVVVKVGGDGGEEGKEGGRKAAGGPLSTPCCPLTLPCLTFIAFLLLLALGLGLGLGLKPATTSGGGIGAALGSPSPSPSLAPSASSRMANVSKLSYVVSG
jgi:hypothetical protein